MTDISEVPWILSRPDLKKSSSPVISVVYKDVFLTVSRVLHAAIQTTDKSLNEVHSFVQINITEILNASLIIE